MSFIQSLLASLSLASLLLTGPLLFGAAASADEATSQSANLATLEEARWAEQQGAYPHARELYQRYLDAGHASQVIDTGLPSRASISLRMTALDEAIRLGFDPAISLLLSAFTLRDNSEFDLAIDQLQEIIAHFPDSYLRDDAQYMIGYISLMDQFNFAVAHEAMRTLLRLYPDSRYTDTALYSEAIALEQTGNTIGARERFVELRKRHAQVSLEFIGLRVPKSNMLSRYWFDRADKRLAILDQRIKGAATIVKRRVVSARARALRVSVDVDGISMILHLTPSRLDSATEFRDGDNFAIERPRAQYFTGVVEGEESSWARVSIEGDSIQGIVQSYGTRYVLKPDTLVGTIDYYQPREPVDANALPPLHDYVMYPPPASGNTRKRNNGSTLLKRNTDIPVTKVAQIAIVVDSQYNDYYGGNGLSHALNVLNVADGIFREDFGLALEVVSATVFADRQQDPMNLGPVTLETMLRNFRSYRLQTANETEEVSLMYLFSGNQNSDEAIGLAWIGAACRTDGFDVGVTTPSPYGDLLVTHELGHSLGALHDSDTSCRVDTNRLMWPRISEQTEQEFTSCSKQSLNAGLAADCYLDSLDLALEMSMLSDTQVQIEAVNNDLTRVAQDLLLTLDGNGIDMTMLPQGCTESLKAELECRSGSVPPGASYSWVFQLAPINGTGVTVMAEVHPVQAADVFIADNTAQLDIRVGDNGATSVSIASGEPQHLDSSSNTTSSINSTTQSTTAAARSGGGVVGHLSVLILCFLVAVSKSLLPGCLSNSALLKLPSHLAFERRGNSGK